MRTLISITTCNRLSDVKKYIWDYLRYVNQDQHFHFVLALDGKEQSYINFCEEFAIPLIYSDEREGVGLSKNRVLTQFPDYDYYFFLDDDIELVNPAIFNHCIEISKSAEIPHLCGNINHVLLKQQTVDHYQLNYSIRGGGYFSFYTKEGLAKVGGWNTTFAQYKRYGHTEHSYRFFHARLQSAPFVFADEFTGMILIHNPASVTANNLPTNENELIQEEQDLIDSGTSYFPFQTLSRFFFNGKPLGFNKKVDEFLRQYPQRYPFLKGKERKNAMAEYYALLINRKRNSHFYNFNLVIKSFINSPKNNELKHAIKTYFK